MYPIWLDEGKFLYVEQALNSTPEKPYRQRIFEVKRKKDTAFTSSVYTLKIEKKRIAKRKNPSFFDSIQKSAILLRKGCEVILKRVGDFNFKGKTKDAACKSSLRGAGYAISKVEIFKDKIISWDKGLDKNGKKVWGATKGGYVFDRLR